MAAAARHRIDFSNGKSLIVSCSNTFKATSYARYVGRVGALAVALGVGVAVATGGSGLAWADAGSTGDADTSSTQGASEDSAAPSKSKASGSVGDDGTDSDAPDADDSVGDPPAMNLGNSSSVDTSVNDAGQSTHTAPPTDDEESEESDLTGELEPDAESDSEVEIEVEDEADEEEDGQAGTSEAGNPEPTANQKDSGLQAASSDEVDRDSGRIDDAAPVVESAVDRDADEVTEQQEETDSLSSQVMLAVENAGYERPVSTTSASDEPDPVPTSASPGAPGSVIGVANTFVAALLSPLLAPSPDAPAQPPLAWALLGWARREWHHMLLNRTPQPVVDTVTTSEDTPITVDVVTGTDPDAVAGDVVNVTEVTQPQNGAVTLEGGTLTYTPNSDFHGTDTFTYTISDEESPLHIHGLRGLWAAIFGGDAGHADTVSVTVTVTPVNDAPVAVDDVVTVDEDSGATVIDVVGNDTDVDGDDLAVTAASAAGNGTVTLVDGVLAYTPDTDFHGTDTFTYTVSDGDGGRSAATVTVTVAAVQDLPAPTDDAYITDEDTALTIAAPGVLDNDVDVDGDDLSVQLAETPLHGVVVLNADGSFTYTPNTDFHGDDSFTYSVADSDGGTATATVHLTVNRVNTPPVVNDDFVTTDEGTPVVISVLDNDFDPDAGDQLTVELFEAPGSGTVVVNDDNTITYRPAIGFHGTDQFTYRVYDGTENSNVAHVRIEVHEQPLVAHDVDISTDEDTSVSIEILVHDPRPGSDIPINIFIDRPEHGNLGIRSFHDGQYTLVYAPEPDFVGTESVTYVLQSADGRVSQPYTVTITVNPVNDAPQAVDDAVTADENSGDAVIDVLANDSDVDDDELTVVEVGEAQNGAVALTDGVITYRPNPDFDGTDSFTYTVADGNGGAATATVTVTVKDADTITFDDGAPPRETFVSGDRRIYVLTGNELRIVDSGTREWVSTVDLGAPPSSLTVSHDGRYAYSGAFSTGGDVAPVTKIDLVTGRSMSIGAVRQPTAMAVSRDGETLYATNYQDGTVSVIDTETGDYRFIDTGLQSRAIAVSEDGETLYVGTIVNDVRAVDVETGHYTVVYAGGWDEMSVADQSITVVGDYAYVADGLNDVVVAIDYKEVVAVYDGIGASPTSVTATPDGAAILVASRADNRVTAISAQLGVLGAIEVGNHPTDIDFAVDEEVAYVTTSDGISVIAAEDIDALFRANPR